MPTKVKKYRLSVSSVALILAIFVGWTLPFALSATTPSMARYVAEAAMEATARVASWDVAYAQQPATATRHENITVFHTHHTATHAAPTPVINRNAAHRSGPVTRPFTIANNSQVTADVSNIVLRYVTADNQTPSAASPTVTGSTSGHGAHNIVFNASPNVAPLAGGVFRHQVGAIGTRTIQIQATSRAGLPGSAIRWYRVFFDAVQVD